MRLSMRAIMCSCVAACAVAGPVEAAQRASAAGMVLFEAIRQDKIETVKNLIEMSPDLMKERSDGETPLRVAALHAGDEVLRHLVSHVTKDPMLLASVAGDHEQIGRLLRRRDTDMKAHTPDERFRPVHLAAMSGSVEAMRALLRVGFPGGTTDWHSCTPLHYAARRGHGDVVAALLEKGAPVDDRSRKGWTALHHAAAGNHLLCVELLLDAGADVRTEIHNTKQTPADLCTDPETKARLVDAVDAAGPPPELPKRDERIITRHSDYMDMVVLPRMSTRVFMADYHMKAIVTYDLRTRKKRPDVLCDGIVKPLGIAALGNRLYVTASGTPQEKYHDGSISCYDLKTRRKTVLATGLSHPTKLVVTADGDIYFLECAGFSTSFPGKDQLCVLRKGKKRKEVVMGDLHRCSALAVDGAGDFYIGYMARSTPGIGGRVERVSLAADAREEIVKDIPSVEDLEFDTNGNLFIAGSGEQPKMWSILVVPPTKPYKAIPIHDKRAKSVAILPRGKLLFDGQKGILYSLSVRAWPQGIRVGGPVKPGARPRTGQEVF